MHPAMMAWWKHHRAHRFGHEHGHGHPMEGLREAAECLGAEGFGRERGRGHGHEHGHERGWFAGHDHHDDDLGGGGTFGVRRPLRFLAYKLDLNEEQVSQLAAVLNDLKTERAQAAVDQRRTISAFAEAIASEAFDATKVGEAAGGRVKIAERLRDAVASALQKIHAILEPEQRAKLAYLIRTGALTL